jgi:drug/metabolite transporter (DMT)-like permease
VALTPLALHLVAALLALLSAALWGSADYLAGRMSRMQSAVVVLAGTQFVGLLAMLIVAVVTRAPVLPADYLPWAVLASVCGAAGLALYYQALATGTMGVVSPIAALGVLVPMVVGVAAGERPTTIQDAGIVVALFGVILASGPEVRGATGWPPVLLAAGSACFLGSAMVGIARGSRVDVVMTMTAMRITTVTLMGVLLAIWRPAGLSLWRKQWGSFVAVGLGDVGANLAFGAAATLGLLAIVSVFGSLYPVATILLAWRLDGERLRPVQYLGVSLALVGAVAISSG